MEWFKAFHVYINLENHFQIFIFSKSDFSRSFLSCPSYSLSNENYISCNKFEPCSQKLWKLLHLKNTPCLHVVWRTPKWPSCVLGQHSNLGQLTMNEIFFIFLWNLQTTCRQVSLRWNNFHNFWLHSSNLLHSMYSLYPTKNLKIRQNVCPTKKLCFLILTIEQVFAMLNDIMMASETISEHSPSLASLALPIRGTLY